MPKSRERQQRGVQRAVHHRLRRATAEEGRVPGRSRSQDPLRLCLWGRRRSWTALFVFGSRVGEVWGRSGAPVSPAPRHRGRPQSAVLRWSGPEGRAGRALQACCPAHPVGGDRAQEARLEGEHRSRPRRAPPQIRTFEDPRIRRAGHGSDLDEVIGFADVECPRRSRDHLGSAPGSSSPASTQSLHKTRPRRASGLETHGAAGSPAPLVAPQRAAHPTASDDSGAGTGVSGTTDSAPVPTRPVPPPLHRQSHGQTPRWRLRCGRRRGDPNGPTNP